MASRPTQPPIGAAAPAVVTILADGIERPLVGPLQGASVTVGRELFLGRGGRFGTVTIDDPEVSRDHLHIWPTPGALLAADVGSTNGTSRDDKPLVGTMALRSGDRLELGASLLVVIGDPPRADHLGPSGARVQLRPAAQLWSRPLPVGTGPRIRLGSAATPGSATDPWASAGSLDLGRHRSVAVVGPPRMAVRHVAAWVLQLAALHPPEDLAIEVLGDPDQPQSARWLEETSRWLPHHPGPGRDLGPDRAR